MNSLHRKCRTCVYIFFNFFYYIIEVMKNIEQVLGRLRVTGRKTKRYISPRTCFMFSLEHSRRNSSRWVLGQHLTNNVLEAQTMQELERLGGLLDCGMRECPTAGCLPPTHTLKGICFHWVSYEDKFNENPSPRAPLL